MQYQKQIYRLRYFLFLTIISASLIYACGPSKKTTDDGTATKSAVIKDTSKTAQTPPPPVKH